MFMVKLNPEGEVGMTNYSRPMEKGMIVPHKKQAQETRSAFYYFD